MSGERNQAAWDAVRRERDEAIGKTDVLAQQVEVMRSALCNLLHRAPAVLDCHDLTHTKKHQHRYDEPCPVTALYDDARDAASSALNLPDIHSDILRKRDANQIRLMLCRHAFDIHDILWLKQQADELEKSNG